MKLEIGDGNASLGDMLGAGIDTGNEGPYTWFGCPSCKHPYGHVVGAELEPSLVGSGDPCIAVVSYVGECGHSWKVTFWSRKGNPLLTIDCGDTDAVAPSLIERASEAILQAELALDANDTETLRRSLTAASVALSWAQ